MGECVLVWDLETIPDLTGYARAHQLDAGCRDMVRSAMGDQFPKLLYHSIVCIGALLATQSDSGWEVKGIDAPHIGNRTEQELIQSFVNIVEQAKPKMITFNGSGFDLPVLRYRSMMHGLRAPGLSARPYFHRFTDDAVDVCDVLSSFSYGGKVKLDEISRVMGLEGKPDGMDGSQVEAYFNAGRIDEIAAYCQSDVVNTFRLWLRYELFRGKIDQKQFAFSEASITCH